MNTESSEYWRKLRIWVEHLVMVTLLHHDYISIFEYWYTQLHSDLFLEASYKVKHISLT